MNEFEKMFDGSVRLGEFATEEDFSQIPSGRGVVLFSDGEGSSILMLTAGNIRARVRVRLGEPAPGEHRRSVPLGAVCRRVWWKLASCAFEGDLFFLNLAGAIWHGDFASLLAWKPAWFIHANAEAEFPHFRRTQSPLADDGSYFGPLPSARAAEKAIGTIRDAFNLCRDISILRRSPRGIACTYGQMNQCLTPCDGTVTMDDYRREFARAVEFLSGRREGFLASLNSRMLAESKGLNFELAGQIKSRIKRLGELDGEDYRFFRPFDKFRFLIVHRIRRTKRGRVFICVGAAVSDGETIKCPADTETIERLLTRARKNPANRKKLDKIEIHRIGLIGRNLFASQKQRGMIFHINENTSAEKITEEINNTIIRK